MPITCRNHPTKPGHFICPECDKAYCPECISKRVVDDYAGKQTHYFCPKCNVPAKTVPVGSLIAPFWNRLHLFFTYPLHAQPLILITILSVFTYLNPFPYAKLILYAVLLQYSYATLTNTAHGNLKPADLSSAILSEGGMSQLMVPVIRQAILYVILYGLTFLLAMQLGPMPAMIFGGISAVLLPAMIMVLVCNESVVQAINPVVLMAVVYRIGWSYLLLVFFLGMILGAPVALAQYFGDLISERLAGFFYIFAEHYYTVMVYNMMGYVLLQFHEEIGYEVDYDMYQKQAPTPAKSGKKLSPRDQLLEDAAKLVQENEIGEAIDLIRRETEGEFKDFLVAERYYKLLKIAGRTAELLKHSAIYLDFLVRRGDKKTALEIYQECLALDQDYALDASHVTKVVEWLSQAGDHKGAMMALVRFTKTNAQHPTLPEIYLLLAKLLREKLNNGKKAKEILQWLLTKYPDHAVKPQVERYLQNMNRPPVATKS